jgi:hypothetical protein
MSRHNEEDDIIFVPPGYHLEVTQDIIDQQLDLNVVFAQCIDGFDYEEACREKEDEPIQQAELPDGLKDLAP